MPRSFIAAAMLVGLTTVEFAAPATRTVDVESGRGLEFVHVVPQPVTYKGQKALRLTEVANYRGEAVALLPDVDFTDGTIEVDLAGSPAAGSDAGARGFAGVAFRAGPHAEAFECFYLRPTNGRADDQLRRNHSTQYISVPGYPWERLRSETPGVYESYVDLETGAWTHVKIEVSGARARLFVNQSAQPVLIVNDLKRGAASGSIGLWIGAGTEAYFRQLRITTS
jgi:hypothetical protein